jgi:hypothetical protein
MGFYVRKSITVGPFRFNLSGSGVSVSTGVRGWAPVRAVTTSIWAWAGSTTAPRYRARR